MIRASLFFVSAAMSATAALIVPMSPFFVLPGVQPQSIRMCCGSSSVGTVIRKKSPKPTRYIRMRSPPLPFFLAAFFLAAVFFAAMSLSVDQGEIHLEAFGVFRFAGDAEVLAEAALLIGALLVEMPGDHVGDLGLWNLFGILVPIALHEYRLTDDQDRKSVV